MPENLRQQVKAEIKRRGLRTPSTGGSDVTRDFAMTLRLHPHIGALLGDVSDSLGMSKTAVLVAALHDYANKHGVER